MIPDISHRHAILRAKREALLCASRLRLARARETIQESLATTARGQERTRRIITRAHRLPVTTHVPSYESEPDVLGLDFFAMRSA